MISTSNMSNVESPLKLDDSSWIVFSYCLLIISIIICLVLQHVIKSTKSTSILSTNNENFLRFQKKYFLVYFLALFGDWLQGPYIYKLYSHYGFTSSQIAMLYVVGFSASVLFGTSAGALADYLGRKKMCMAFCVIYSLCCILKVFPNYNILLLGRLFGGVSTSLLFSVFESWYVYEHIQGHDFPKEWISITFSKATFWNGVLAIIAGILANFFSESLNFGPISPFIIAIPCFLLCCCIMYKEWGENYGIKQSTVKNRCLEGVEVILTNKLIFMLGIVQSLFESVMYVFVFLWTPIIDIKHPPLGIVFSIFMVCIMIGSSIYQLFIYRGVDSQYVLFAAIILATVSQLGCALATSHSNTNIILAFGSFMLLEIAVGIYFPAIGYIKSEFIPESHRANIMNWFRVPLNIITCAILLWLYGHTNANGNCMIFILCSCMMIICAFVMSKITKNMAYICEQKVVQLC